MVVPTFRFSSVSRLGLFHPYVVALKSSRSFQQFNDVCTINITIDRPSIRNSLILN
nr:MAG TPA: hypothetical protein [Bacteriophage sp.]